MLSAILTLLAALILIITNTEPRETDFAQEQTDTATLTARPTRTQAAAPDLTAAQLCFVPTASAVFAADGVIEYGRRAETKHKGAGFRRGRQRAWRSDA